MLLKAILIKKSIYIRFVKEFLCGFKYCDWLDTDDDDDDGDGEGLHKV